MNRECLCDLTSEEASEEKRVEDEDEEETLPCNRIFLNFTRECRHPAKDRYNLAKVKDFFKYLSERADLQEMKVSGWRDDDEEEIEEDEEEEGEKDGLESFYGDDDDDSSRRCGGQRFAMSRDFWYRKLNTLKAQKLDEAALEAKDIPPDNANRPPECLKLINNAKKYSSDVSENPEDILREIDTFTKCVAKPVEKELKKRFVNVYDERRQFAGTCRVPE